MAEVKQQLQAYWGLALRNNFGGNSVSGKRFSAVRTMQKTILLKFRRSATKLRSAKNLGAALHLYSLSDAPVVRRPRGYMNGTESCLPASHWDLMKSRLELSS